MDAAARKRFEFGQHAVDDLLCRFLAVARDAFGQPLRTVLFFGEIARFRDPVGAGHENISRLQLARAARVLRVGKEPDHRAAFLEQPVFPTGAVHHNGWNVSRVDVMQSVAARVQQTQEHAQEFPRLGVVEDHFVQRQRQHLQRMQVGHQRAQRRLQVRHHHRRRHALAFHVGHHQQQRLRSQREEIVVVAAYFVAGLVAHRQLISGDDRRRIRQQAALDAARHFQFALDALFLQRRPVQARVFQRHRHVSG